MAGVTLNQRVLGSSPSALTRNSRENTVKNKAMRPSCLLHVTEWGNGRGNQTLGTAIFSLDQVHGLPNSVSVSL